MIERTTTATATPTAAANHSFGRLLLVTHESLGEKMAGPSIRAWELARAAARHGVPVMLATPFPTPRSAPNVEICQYVWEDPNTLRRLIDRADVVMSTGPVMARIVFTLGAPIEKPVIVDTYYVPEIEQIMLSLARKPYDFDPTPAYLQDMFVYLRQGDYFTCALENQVDFWSGALMAAGRINEAALRDRYNIEHLIGVVPLGLPDAAPQPAEPRMKGVIPGIGPRDTVLYWGGGVWDWTDPFTLMDALKIINRQREDVRVVFGALHHYERTIVPVMTAAGRLVERIQQEGWQGSKVFFLDWVNYDQRAAYLLEADLGVSLAPRTLESRYAIRSRLLDHLWTGLPGVLSEGDEMAKLLAGLGLAKIVPPGEAQATAQAVLDYLETPHLREKLNEAAAETRARYQWSNVVGALVNFMQNPRRAPDADYARSTIGYITPLRREWEVLRAEKAALQQEVRTLRGSRPVRMADALGNLLAKVGIKI